MIACLDVDYRTDVAYAAIVGFHAWTDARPATEAVVKVTPVEPYVPGEFYRRELPCLLRALKEVPPADIVIVDGYVWLDGPAKPGLGAHLYEALTPQVPVIGVAKTAFRNAHDVDEVYRGASQRPLFVSTVGMPLNEAAQHIRTMHGANRIPTLLKRVDQLARQK